MIELKNREQFDAAIKRAKADAKNLLVQMADVVRQYRVVNCRNGFAYTVSFKVTESGQRFGECNCPAGVDRVCKHIAAAAALNMYLAEADMLHRNREKAQ
jgi:hypothetical protein